MDPTRDISVIICAYTEARWDDLCEAVLSLEHQTVAPREIIVVIDHNDSLRARVAERLPGVRLVENTQARGLAGARNCGVAAARGALVAFLDDDAVAAPDWLEKLASGYSAPEVMGVGGAIRPIWPSARPPWFPHEFDWVVGCTYRGLPVDTARLRNLIGANMSFKREIFDDIGGFRNGMGRIGTRPVGCEETEFCIRASERWPERHFLYVPAAVVRHRVPGSRANWAYYRSRCYAEGLSKARVTRLVGAGAGLRSERKHALRTLPGGIAANLKGVLLHGDLAGVLRAGAIIAGLAVTTLGYVAGTAQYVLPLQETRSA